jgi:hypothetical protein
MTWPRSAARIAIRLPFKPIGSCFPGCLGKERAHQRLELLAPAPGALVLPPLSRPDGEGERHILLAPLAVELIVGHGGPSLLPSGRAELLACREAAERNILLHHGLGEAARLRDLTAG